MSAAVLPSGIQQHGQGFRFTYRHVDGGRRKSPVYPTLEAAVSAREESRAAMAAGRAWVPTATSGLMLLRVTFAQFLRATPALDGYEGWLAWWSSTGRPDAGMRTKDMSDFLGRHLEGAAEDRGGPARADWIDLPISAITRLTIEEWANSVVQPRRDGSPGVSEDLRGRLLWAINHALLRAADMGVFGIATSPIGQRSDKGQSCVNLRLRPAPAPQRIAPARTAGQVFTGHDARLLLDALRWREPWALLAGVLLIHTGLRLSELCGLLVSDVDLENRWLYVQRRWYGGKKALDATTGEVSVVRGRRGSKTVAGTRVIPFGPYLAVMLTVLIEAVHGTDPDPHARLIAPEFTYTREVVRRRMTAAAAAAGVELPNLNESERSGPHGLRSSLNTRLAAFPDVSREVRYVILGHAVHVEADENPVNELIYRRVPDHEWAAAAAALDAMARESLDGLDLNRPSGASDLIPLTQAPAFSGYSYARLWQLVRAGVLPRHPAPYPGSRTKVWVRQSDLPTRRDAAA
jgi:integrase